MSDYWRDTATEEAQFHFDVILGTGLRDAEKLAKKHGEFYPFALIWPTDAEEPQVVMTADDPFSDHPDSQVLIERLETILRDRRDELYAAALVSDVYVDGQSAISVIVEHRDGIHFTVLRLYHRRKVGRGWKLGEFGGGPSEPRIWT